MMVGLKLKEREVITLNYCIEYVNKITLNNQYLKI